MTSQEQHIKEIKQEIKKYASGDMIPSLDDTLQECNAVVTRSILGAFGVSLFGDFDGGHVTTIHNFEKKITATTRDYIKYCEYTLPYSAAVDRKHYSERQVTERRNIIKSEAPIFSGYTGRELPHDGRAHLEHIVPVKEIESTPQNFLFMDQAARVDLAYNPQNLTMLESYINQSKNDMPLKEWLGKEVDGVTNAERFGIDQEMALRRDDEAREAIRNAQRSAALKKQGKELVVTGLEQGLKLGMREVIALVLIEFNDEAIICTRRIMKSYRQGNLTFDEVIGQMKTALVKTKDRVLAKHKEVIDVFLSGVGSGFLSNLIVFIINNIITTSGHMVTIIRELVYAMIRTGKILCSNQYSSAEEKHQAAAKVLTYSTSICLTVLLGEAIRQQLPWSPYREEISQALSAIVAGVSIVMISYYYQSMQAEVLATTAAVTQTAIYTAEVFDAVSEEGANRESRKEALASSTQRMNELKI